MKKTILTIASLLSVASFAQVQGISNVAANDLFQDGSSFVEGNNPVAVVTDKIAWNDTTKAPNAAKKAYKGIYWWTDGATGGLDFSSVRNTGKLSYTLTQPLRSYEPIGVGFGEYAETETSTTSSKFTLDLSANAEMSVTIKRTSDAPFRVEFQLQDANGKKLTANKEVLSSENGGSGANLYDDAGRIQLLFSAESSAEQTLTYNWKNAVYGYYTAGTDNSKDEPTFTCTNVQNVELPSVTNFAYDKVVAVTMTFTSTVESADDCYRHQGLTGATFEISSFKLGDVSTIVGVSDEIIAEFKSGKVNAYNLSTGALVASGSVEEVAVNLENGVYVFKQGSLTKKVAIVK